MYYLDDLLEGLQAELIEAQKLIGEQMQERLDKNNQVDQHLSWYDEMIPAEWVVILSERQKEDKHLIVLGYR